MGIKRLTQNSNEFAGFHKVKSIDTFTQITMLARDIDGKQLRSNEPVL